MSRNHCRALVLHNQRRGQPRSCLTSTFLTLNIALDWLCSVCDNSKFWQSSTKQVSVPSYNKNCHKPHRINKTNINELISSSACFFFLQIVSDNVLQAFFMFCNNCSHTDNTPQESLSKIFAAFSFHDCTLTERKARPEFGSCCWVFRFLL